MARSMGNTDELDCTLVKWKTVYALKISTVQKDEPELKRLRIPSLSNGFLGLFVGSSPVGEVVYPSKLNGKQDW